MRLLLRYRLVEAWQNLKKNALQTWEHKVLDFYLLKFLVDEAFDNKKKKKKKKSSPGTVHSGKHFQNFGQA